MEKKKPNPFRWFSLLIPLFLAGCSIQWIQPENSSGPASSDSSSITTSESQTTSEGGASIDSEQSQTSSVTSSEESVNSSEEASSSEESSSESSSETSIDSRAPATFEFYSVNDFHGAINSDGSYEVGAAKYFSYLKQRKEADPEHVILLSAGDMFQGSYESNVNYGNLVTELCNISGFDAMTIGNHEFDYGREYLAANKELAEFPFLGANIYKYRNWTITDEFWSEGADKSVVLERDDYRIGIVGVIGTGQTSSITSDRVADLAFDDAELYATREAKRLKKDENCDIVVLVIHDDAKSIIGGGDYSPWGLESSLKTYFDGVFCGHSHTENNYTSSEGVPLLQAYKNGANYSHMTLSIDQGEITCDKAEILTAKTVATELDSDIVDKIDEYLTPEILAQSNLVAGTLTGTLNKGQGIGTLGAAAIYNEYKDQGIVLAIQNIQRANITAGTVKYGDLYKAMPFTNNIIILNAKGSEIKREVSYNYAYSETLESRYDLVDSQYYKIACIDYLVFHQNVGRNYDYFPGLGNGSDTILATYETYPVDLVFDYIQNELHGVIDASDYNSGQPGVLR